MIEGSSPSAGNKLYERKFMVKYIGYQQQFEFTEKGHQYAQQLPPLKELKLLLHKQHRDKGLMHYYIWRFKLLYSKMKRKIK